MTNEPFAPRNDREAPLLAAQISLASEVGSLAEMSGIVEKMGSGYGICLNPGGDAGLGLPAAVRQLAQTVATSNHNKQ